MTSIATWNLHHMGRQLKIRDGVAEVIAHQRPDVLVFTEYVERTVRSDLRAAFKRMRYQEAAISLHGKGQNQVLLASLEDQEDGDIPAPEVDEAACTNFLSRHLRTLDLDVVGFRVPYYQAEDPRKLGPYWEQFTRAAREAIDSRVVFIGDFNVGRTKKDEAGNATLNKLTKAGYRLLGPVDGADRALVSPSLTVRSFSVIEAVAGYRLTGKKGLSDHPMLVVDVE
jgi:exonuclease III